MPTAASSTETRTEPWIEAARDLGHLVRFRIATVRRPWTLAVTATALMLLTLGAATLPALLVRRAAGAAPAGGDAVLAAYRHDALVLLPTALAGFWVVATAAAVASAGGRELLERDPAAVHPIDPLTDHLGALLLAPLNLVWILQAWALLAATAFAVPAADAPAAQLGIVLWLVLATTLAQLVGWTAEAARRTARGAVTVRVAVAVLAVGVTWLHLTGGLAPILDHLPTRWLVDGLVDGPGWPWVLRVVVEVVVTVAAVGLGALPARVAVRRTPREELRVDSGDHAAGRAPRSDLAALVRVDRASVWRAVPVRRGVAVLGIGPVVAALFGSLTWTQLTVLPGLLASGAALLFGVNAWCLDGRGVLWRESLPVPPATVFGARTLVLGELLAVASAAAAVPAVRAGSPSGSELVALLAVWVVVVVQVLSTAMRWSAQRPAAADLRSPRSTPAPPLAMVGYSAKLAVATTMTSLVFAVLARQPDPRLPAVAAVPFLLWSAARLLATRRTWADPTARVRVVGAVAG